jgi:hypothetical protein
VPHPAKCRDGLHGVSVRSSIHEPATGSPDLGIDAIASNLQLGNLGQARRDATMANDVEVAGSCTVVLADRCIMSDIDGKVRVCPDSDSLPPATHCSSLTSGVVVDCPGKPD